MQDKDAKIAYLQKIINVVGIVLGQPVPAKPSKVNVDAGCLNQCSMRQEACASTTQKMIPG